MFEAMPEPATVDEYAILLKMRRKSLCGLLRRHGIARSAGRRMLVVRDDIRIFLSPEMRYEKDCPRTLDLAFLSLCRAADQRTKNRVTYFIRAADRSIKIGYTISVESRLQDLQFAHAYSLELLTTVKGGMALEQELHRRFEAHRLKGEWFAPGADLLAFIGHIRGKVVDA